MGKKVDIREEWSVCIHSDLYEAGTAEDGRPYSAECYYLIASDLKGYRVRHDITFFGCKKEVDEDGYSHFCDVRTEVLAEAEHLLARVMDHGIIDMDHWSYTEPAYGSDYYCMVNNC